MLIDTEYLTKVSLPYGQLKELLLWCHNNCCGDWGYSVIDDAGYEPGQYLFKFEVEEDLITFILKAK